MLFRVPIIKYKYVKQTVINYLIQSKQYYFLLYVTLQYWKNDI